MSQSAERGRPLLLCALEYERRHLLCAGLDIAAEVQCCGPGGDNIQSWAQRVEPSNRVVILCGVAGGLSPDLATGDAMMASEVVDTATGRRWQCAFAQIVSQVLQVPSCSIAGSSEIRTSPQAKRELFEKSGAMMVDTESAEFAHAATGKGWCWLIIRGISDGADASLPAETANWVDAAGRTKTLAVIGAMIRHPSLLRDLLRLRRNSAVAMKSVVEFVRKVIDLETTESRSAN